MQALGTRTVVVWRSNKLAQLVCIIRDCFNQNLERDGLARRVGPNEDACFGRRELAEANQTKACGPHAAPTQPPPHTHTQLRSSGILTHTAPPALLPSSPWLLRGCSVVPPPPTGPPNERPDPPPPSYLLPGVAQS